MAAPAAAATSTERTGWSAMYLPVTSAAASRRRWARALVVEAEDGPPSYRAVAANLQMPVGSLGPTRARCLSQLRKLLDTSGI